MSTDNLYKLKVDQVMSKCYASSQSIDWHARLGHTNQKSLEVLKQKGPLPVSTAPSNCQACLLGKSTKMPQSKKSIQKATAPLQIIHSDICGPINAKSTHGYQYYITFIDEFSGFIHIKPLTHKDEALSAFKYFLAKYEGQAKGKVSTLRTDRGGEFISNSFKEYLLSKSINHGLSTPHKPQPNGIAERASRTLNDMARTLLIAAKLPPEFWPYAINIIPKQKLKFEIPLSLFLGQNFDYSYLRPFGCSAFVHDINPVNSKFSPRAEKGFLLGFIPESKAYFVYLPSKGKTVISKDIKFIDEEFYDVPVSHDNKIILESLFSIEAENSQTDASDQSHTESMGVQQYDTRRRSERIAALPHLIIATSINRLVCGLL